MADGRVPTAARAQVLAAAGTRTDPHVRDLFERFLPDSQRIQRLGNVTRPDFLLAMKGDAARGRELFFQAAGTQCVNCHRIGGTGGTLGPDLSEIGKKYVRPKILENILEPSKEIDPKYVAYLLVTTEGQSHTGTLLEKNDARGDPQSPRR